MSGWPTKGPLPPDLTDAEIVELLVGSNVPERRLGRHREPRLRLTRRGRVALALVACLALVSLLLVADVIGNGHRCDRVRGTPAEATYC